MSRLPDRRNVLAGLAGLAVPGTLAGSVARAQASDARFRVEAIVFRLAGAPPPAAPAASEFADPPTSPGRIELLPAAAWRLGHLAGGLRRSAGYRVLGHAAWLATVAENGTATARLDEVLGAAAGVAGTVTVQRGQFLFLRVDARWTASDGGVQRLRERRRIRFDERHYFDHPGIGVIAQVSQAAG